MVAGLIGAACFVTALLVNWLAVQLLGVQARELLQARYRIAHATLQVEPSDHTGCDELEW